MRILIIFYCLLFTCCSISAKPDQYIPRNVSLDGTKIIVNGKIYAELLLIEKNPYGDSYRGIAIHYLPTDRFEWISPQKGWKLKKGNKIYEDIPQVIDLWGNEPFRRYEMIQGSSRVGGDSYFKLEWRGDIKLSDDGSSIIYQEASLFGPKEHLYRIIFYYRTSPAQGFGG